MSDFINGRMYVRIEEWADRPDESEFVLESLGQAWDKQGIMDYIRKQIYPRTLFQEHLKENLHRFFGQTVSQAEHTYRNTLGYPVPMTVSEISDAIIALVEDRNRILGLRHPRQNPCGERVILGPGELPGGHDSPLLLAPYPRTSWIRSRFHQGWQAVPSRIPATQTLRKGTSSCKRKGI
jgi:hypothetical protein